MTISQVGSTVVNQQNLPWPSSGTVSLVMTKPTGTVEGDIIICNIIGQQLTLDTSQIPTGFAQVVTIGTQWVYWKRATASEPANYTFVSVTGSPNTNQVFSFLGAMTSWRAVAQDLTFSATATASGQAVPFGAVASITTTVLRWGIALTSWTCDPPVVFSPADGTGGYGSPSRGTQLARTNDPPMEMLLAEEAVLTGSYTISGTIGPSSPNPNWTIAMVMLSEPPPPLWPND